MNRAQFASITRRYSGLRVAVAGDFCLDRYLEIDPAKQETSLETGLPVHNVVHVRSQPGGAGTILNNLAALGVGEIYPVGFVGEDGEGMELMRALRARPGVRQDHFFSTPDRHTFTYCKPLLLHPDRPPEELHRLDTKNWTPTPTVVRNRIVDALQTLAGQVHALILLDQVDHPETGVVTAEVLRAVGTLATRRPDLWIVADSRRGLRGYPPVCLKMNRAELAVLSGFQGDLKLAQVRHTASTLARNHGRLVLVTLAEEGMVGAAPDGQVVHAPAMPVTGAIDIVGAGDAVTANVTAAWAAGAALPDALELASAAAAIVVRQLGTTGTASVEQMESLLFPA